MLEKMTLAPELLRTHQERSKPSTSAAWYASTALGKEAMMRRKRKEFERMLIDCVDCTLKEILGETASAAVLRHMGAVNMVVQTDGFPEALERIFGSAAYILQKRILEDLYSEVGGKFQEKDRFKFADYVNEVKTAWLKMERRNRRESKPMNVPVMKA